MKRTSLLPYNLQFFAEGDGTEGEGAQGSTDTSQDGGTDSGAAEGTGDQSQETGKTFTQDEVSKISAREKNQGKNSILKMFGCADEKTAKAEAEEFKKWRETQKTEEEKRAEAEKQLKDSAAESEKRAVAAENKLTALAAGVTNDSLDDALAIALLKVTEEKPLETVLAEMKKEPRYSGFFGGSSSNGGTGSSADHNKGGQGGKGNIGERLAKSRIANAPTKSNFFTN